MLFGSRVVSFHFWSNFVLNAFTSCRIVGEHLGLVVEVRRRDRSQFGRGEIAGAKLDEVLADEDRGLPVIDFREVVGLKRSRIGTPWLASQ